MSDKISMVERMVIAHTLGGAITANSARKMRRALQEMRTPTEAMVMAAKNVIDIETLKAAQISLTPYLMREALIAAIDEALK